MKSAESFEVERIIKDQIRYLSKLRKQMQHKIDILELNLVLIKKLEEGK